MLTAFRRSVLVTCAMTKFSLTSNATIATQTPHRERVAPSNGPVVPSQTRQQELAVPGDHQEGRPAAQQSAEAVQSHQHVSRGPGPAATYAKLSFVSRFLFYCVYNKKTFVYLWRKCDFLSLPEKRRRLGLI